MKTSDWVAIFGFILLISGMATVIISAQMQKNEIRKELRDKGIDPSKYNL